MKDIPIFLVNFNRLYPIQALTKTLLDRNYTNITIIDNHSEYLPLLEWYDRSCPVKVFHLNQNVGPYVLNITANFKEITTKGPYVLSDGDVVPIDEVPKDFIDHMLEVAQKHNIPKVGLSLKIDDLPDWNKFKAEIIKHESVFTTFGHIDSPYGKVWKAPVDTTFGVCITPHSGMEQGAYRMDYPYTARHIPWYYNTDNLPEDEKLLKATKLKHIGHWSSK